MKNPFMTDTAWMKRALTVAGNYAEGDLRPTTPIYMSKWLRNKMLNFGYTQVDLVFLSSNLSWNKCYSTIHQSRCPIYKLSWLG